MRDSSTMYTAAARTRPGVWSPRVAARAARFCPCGPARRKGAVLLLVLIVFAALSLLSFGLCHRVRLQVKAARMRGDELRAYYLALGGIQRVAAALREDMEQRGSGDGADQVVHFGQPWWLDTTAEQEGFFQDRSKQWHESCRLSYATSDEEGRLNINGSSPAGWAHLPGMTEEVLHAIVDWQDEDDTPGAGGAESAEYLRRSPPYRAKNADLAMVWELALIQDVEWPLLIGEDANGNMVLDAEGEDDGPERLPMDNANGELDQGFIDYFTVYGEGKVNLNTASLPVLLALLAPVDRDGVAARGIVAFRAGADGQPFTPDDRFLSSFRELADVPGVGRVQAEVLERDYGTLGSRHFRVVSQAVVREGCRPCRLSGTFRRDDQGIRLILLRPS